MCHRGRVEEQRGEDEHDEVLGEPHVVDHDRPSDARNRDGRRAAAVRGDGRPGQVGRPEVVAEDAHLAGPTESAAGT